MSAAIDAWRIDHILTHVEALPCECSPADPDDCCPRCTVLGLLRDAPRYDAAEIPW